MAQSTCVKCGGTRFEMQEKQHVIGTALVWFFLQCADCGGVAGVVDYHPNRNLLHRLNAIAQKLGIRQ